MNRVARASRSGLWRWIPALLWMGVIFYLSSIPPIGGLPAPDYTLHFASYFVLACLYWWASALSFDWEWRRRILILLVLVITYGISDELHQSFVPGREVSLADLTADGAGGLTALLLLAHPRLLYFRTCLFRHKADQ